MVEPLQRVLGIHLNSMKEIQQKNLEAFNLSTIDKNSVNVSKHI